MTCEFTYRTVVSDFARCAGHYSMNGSKTKGAFVLHLAAAGQFCVDIYVVIGVGTGLAKHFQRRDSSTLTEG